MRIFNISDKLAFVFMFLLIFMGIGGTVGIYNAFKIDDLNKELYNKFFKGNDFLFSAESEFLTQHQQVLLFISVNDKSSRSFLKREIDNHVVLVDRVLLDYMSLDVSDESINLLDTFNEYYQEYLKDQNVIFSLENISTLSALELNNLKSTISKQFNETLSALNNVVRQERIELNDAYRLSENRANLTLTVTVFLAIGAIAFAFVVWYFLSKSIVRPILALGEAARHMSLGDFKHRAPVLKQDEIGLLATEFNKMAENLENIYSTLERKVDERTEFLNDANLELSKKQSELEEKNIQLAHANQMKSHFLANVSHELRTPLNSIIGFSELLQESTFGDLNEKQTQYVEYIHSSGLHLLQLINEILDLTKIEAGMLKLLLEEFSIDEVLGEVLGSTKPLANKKNVAIKSQKSKLDQIVTADRSKFKQIMLNLLSNGIKFNNDGGTVDVSWGVVKNKENTSDLSITVSDTGIGIKDSDKDKLFVEFEQLDPQITREYGGTGLGLALTKKLVELHHGRIDAVSEYGVGTSFTFTLPILKLKNEVVEGQIVFGGDDSVEISAEMSNKVLLLTESFEVNGLVAEYLEDAGFKVIFADDGVDLLEKVSSVKPRVVIMGIALRRLDGWEILRKVKDNPDISHVPIIVVSADDNRDMGFEMGVLEFLDSPDREKILHAIESIR